MVFKKGIISAIPLSVIAILFIGGLSIISIRHEQGQKKSVGKVLSSSDEDEDSIKGSSSSGSGTSGKSEDDDSSGPGSKDAFKVESKTDDSKVKIETKPNKTKIDVKTEEGRFKTEVRDGREKTTIKTDDLKIRWEVKNGIFKLTVKFKTGEDVEVEDDDEDELIEDAMDELEQDDIQVATGSAEPGFIQRGRRVRTNFPLSVNPLTGELFVVTPAGEKVVAILPDVAIQNMIRAGILTRVDEEPEPNVSPTPEATASAEPGGTPSAAPGEGTPSVSVEGAGIELTEVDSQPVYIISGVRSENFIGLVPVDIKLKAVVSAESGGLLDIRQGFLSRLLDLLSF